LPEDPEHVPKADAAARGDRASGGRAYRTSAKLEAVVMAILRASPKPLGAYMIARKSRALGAPLAPNQVYRILDRLSEQVRRVELLNAYFEASGDGAAIICCRNCNRAQTLDIDIADDVARLCSTAGFRADKLIAEVTGLCAKCRSSQHGLHDL
jgi:Fur family zinc uptake transcriptional regulator